MKKYIGTKIIKAEPMLHGVACAYIGRECNVERHPQDALGYLVEYEDGYQSWSPVDAFEKAYDLLTTKNDLDTVQELVDLNANAPRLNPDVIENVITGQTWTMMPSGKGMICEITLINGFSVRGESATVSASNFDEVMGRKISFANAKEKIWGFEGYLLQQRIYEAGVCKTCIDGQCDGCPHYEGSD